MSELERRIERARDLLQVDLTPADTTQAILRLEDTRRRRTRRRVATGVTVAVAAAALLAVQLGSEAPRPEPSPSPGVARVVPDPTPAPEPAPVVDFATDDETPKRTVVFSDGSLAVLVQPDTQLRMEASEPELLELSLITGEARFNVEKDPGRLFRVRTADLRVEVLGTRFSVSESPDGVSSVKVHEGRVAVFRANDRHELGPGMRLTWDGRRVVIEDESEPKRRTRRRRARSRRRPAASAEPKAWTRLAHDGRFDDAYVAMRDERRGPSDAAELMLAADVARLSGHPREATRYLRRVIADHRDQPQGMLAAFTLGRILRRELGEPRAAAEAFQTARTLAPTGSLAEDALANEAECRARAGESDAARALASQYLRQYPAGRKAGSMRRLVGPAR